MAMKTLLVIDDEPGYLEMLEFNLSGYGYRLLSATRGRAALEIMEKEKVDLVLTDMRMPEMDGLDVIQAIRKNHPKVPVLLMSAYAVEDRTQQAYALTGHPCVKKPFTLDALNAIVHSILINPPHP